MVPKAPPERGWEAKGRSAEGKAWIASEALHPLTLTSFRVRPTDETMPAVRLRQFDLSIGMRQRRAELFLSRLTNRSARSNGIRCALDIAGKTARVWMQGKGGALRPGQAFVLLPITEGETEDSPAGYRAPLRQALIDDNDGFVS